MHNALTDNYFVVSLVYSASLGRGGGGSDQTPHAYLPVWCPLRLWAPGLYSPTCPMDNLALVVTQAWMSHECMHEASNLHTCYEHQSCFFILVVDPSLRGIQMVSPPF